MNRILKNTLAVLSATAFTALVVVGGVQATTVALGDSATAVASATQVCPATGCSATSCHATSGGGGGGQGGGRHGGSDQEWE